MTTMTTTNPTTDKRGRCGTRAGYRAHYRRGERPCKQCTDAHNAARRATAAAKRAGTYTPKRRATRHVDAVDAALGPVTPEALENAAREHTARISATGEVTPPPAYLLAPGLALWRSVTAEYRLTDGALAVLGETCRSVDRLERLAAALAAHGVAWFELGDVDDAGEFRPVVVNIMIAEARKLQGAVRQHLTALGVVAATPRTSAEGPASIIETLTARRAARLEAQR